MKVLVAILLNLMLIMGFSNDKSSDRSKLTAGDFRKIEHLKNELNNRVMIVSDRSINKAQAEDWQDASMEAIVE
jgi:hypothetical protein